MCLITAMSPLVLDWICQYRINIKAVLSEDNKSAWSQLPTQNFDTTVLWQHYLFNVTNYNDVSIAVEVSEVGNAERRQSIYGIVQSFFPVGHIQTR